MANPNATITRTGDNFTCRHVSKNEAETVSLRSVFVSASHIIGVSDRTTLALSFLSRSLETLADTGRDLDEYGVRGIAAICDIIADFQIATSDNHRVEASIIDEMAQTVEY